MHYAQIKSFHIERLKQTRLLTYDFMECSSVDVSKL